MEEAGNSVTAAIPGKLAFISLLALALSLTWIAMSPCLHNGFTNWDELPYIINNPNIKTLSLKSVKTIFSTADIGMYSPLSTLSYALNYRFAGLSPGAFHMTDLLLHLANTALVMVLTRLLLGGLWPAFFTALLFGIHPAHVESVAWAAERKDVLYALFYLSALTVYASDLGKAKAWPLSFALFICALLSKPMALTLPLALLLVDDLKPDGIRPRHWLYKIPFFAAAAVFAIALKSAPSDMPHIPWAIRLGLPLYNLGFYIYTLLWPFRLSAMYVLPPAGKPAALIFAALAAAGLALLWKYFRRDKEVFFGAAFYITMLLPVLQFVPFGPVISADRYTYLSSIGIFIIMAACVPRILRRLGPAQMKAAAVFAVLAVFVLAAAARVRCAVWRDGVSLWSDTVQKQPEASSALLNLCSAYGQAGLTSEAESCLSLAIRKDPYNGGNYCNLGILYARRKEFAKAEKCFMRALDLAPCNATALNNMGNLRMINGGAADAERYYERAVQCGSVYAATYLNLGKLALARKDKAAALLLYEKALAADPADKHTRAILDSLR